MTRARDSHRIARFRGSHPSGYKLSGLFFIALHVNFCVFNYGSAPCLVDGYAWMVK